MDLVLLLARLLFAALFIASGLGHIRNREAMTGYAKFKNVPMPGAAVVISGWVFILGGFSVLLGIRPDLGALAIAVMLLPTAFIMHAYWKETDPQSKQMETIAFNKDLALAGGALALFVLFNQFGDELSMMLVR